MKQIVFKLLYSFSHGNKTLNLGLYTIICWMDSQADGHKGGKEPLTMGRENSANKKNS